MFFPQRGGGVSAYVPNHLISPCSGHWCQYNIEMGSKLEIAPRLFNHNFNSNNPKIPLLPVSENGAVEIMPFG